LNFITIDTTVLPGIAGTINKLFNNINNR